MRLKERFAVLVLTEEGRYMLQMIGVEVPELVRGPFRSMIMTIWEFGYENRAKTKITLF